MLQVTVLSFCVLSDDDNINVVVSSFDSREALATHNIGKEIKICSVGSKTKGQQKN